MNNDKIVLEIESLEYECSKKELSKFSEYFEIMFTRDFAEKKMTRIQLKNVSRSSWECIQDYMKNGSVKVDSDNCLNEMLDLLETANRLRFTQVEDHCSDVISGSVATGNCLKILEVASRVESEKLIRKARAFALWNFDQVADSDDFFCLHVDQLEGYCSDPALHSYSGEWGVWTAVEKWTKFPSESAQRRRQHIPRLLLCLRLKSLATDDLKRMLSSDSIDECSLVGKVVARVIETRKKGSERRKECDENEGSDEIDLFIEKWLKVEPRKLPSVPCIVGNVSTGSDVLSPHVIKFCEKEKKFVPLTKLDMVERSGGIILGFKVVSDGFKMYLVGGSSLTRQNLWNDSVWTYDSLKKAWTSFASLSKPIRHMSICLLGNEIYVIGGVGRHRVIQNQVGKISLENGLWSDCASMPRNLYSAPCVAFRDSIYLFDGNVYVYEPGENVWSTISIKPFDVGFSCAMADDSYIYLAGVSTKAVYKFDPCNPREGEMAIVGHFKHECHQACLIDGFIYSLSQDDDSGNVFCEKMNVETGNAIVLYEGKTDSDLSSRHHHGCFAFFDY